MPASGKREKKVNPEIDIPIPNGVFMFPNGDKYDGHYILKNGFPVRSGYGEHTTSDGVVYKGKWESDKMNGRGLLIHKNGSQYDGDFVDNMMHGHGIYTWSDGSKYEGPFFNNSLEGDGKYIDSKNQTWRGQFCKKYARNLRFELNL